LGIFGRLRTKILVDLTEGAKVLQRKDLVWSRVVHAPQ